MLTDERGITSVPPRCGAIRKDGEPCRGVRLPDSEFCFSHDPRTEPRRVAAQALSLAVRASKTPRDP